MTLINPWNLLVPSTQIEQFTLLRVNRELNPQDVEISWALTSTGHPALLITYEPTEKITNHVPKFKYIRIGENVESHVMIIELLDLSRQDMFKELCNDVLRVLEHEDRNKIRNVTVERLRQWEKFLSPDHSRLSPEEQKGLIGELLFLHSIAIPSLGEHEAIMGWNGPERANKDFSYGQVSIEVKTKRGSDHQYIQVSSELQLMTNICETFYLSVYEINSSPKLQGHTLCDYISMIRDDIASAEVLEMFNSKIERFGYLDIDDYEDVAWSEGKTSYFHVRDDFPRITSLALPPSINSVSYRININECAKYKVSKDVICDSLKGPK